MAFEVLNKQKALQFFNDEGMYLRFLKIFLDETLDSSIQQIKAAHSAKGWKALRGHAHSLKGASGYIGADFIHDLSRQAQEACDKVPIDEAQINELVAQLCQQAEILRKEPLPGPKTPTAAPSPTSPASRQRVPPERVRPPAIVTNATTPILKLDTETQPEFIRITPLKRTVLKTETLLPLEPEVDPYARLNQGLKCRLF